MRRFLWLAMAVLALVAAPLAQAQKKQKDPILEQFLIQEFGQINSRMEQIGERLAAIDAELARQKQQQADLGNEVRNAQNLMKASDTSLTNMRLSTQQDLFSLKSDLAHLRQDIAGLGESLRKSLAPPPTAAPAAEAAPVEGYITAVNEKDVTINLGSAAGIKEGARLQVYRSSDPKTQIGIVEVTQLLDANNSKAMIIFTKPGTRFEFSDIVRPMAP